MIGCCNSGTTILWQSLLSHAHLSGPPSEGQDLADIPDCMTHFLGKQTFRQWAHPKFKDSYRLTERNYEITLAERLTSIYADYWIPGTRFIEKSPPNLMRVRFLQSVFPNALFVMIVKNGLAVAEGIRRKRWYDPDRQHMAGLHTHLEDAAVQWCSANKILLEDRKFLKRSIVVRYEDLVTNPRKTLHKVLRFCELSYDGFPIPVFEIDHNQKQVGRLTGAEKAKVLAIESKVLADLGYIDVESGTASLLQGAGKI